MRPAFILLLALCIAAAYTAQAHPNNHVNSLAARGNALRFAIPHTGPVTITGAALAAAGWDLNAIDPRAIHLVRGGTEYPLALDGVPDGGRLAPDSALRFVAAPSQSRYEQASVYWLTHDTALGLRSVVPTTTARPLRWEQRNTYNPRFAGADGDHWFGRELFAGRAVSLTLDLPAMTGGTLRLRLTSETLGPHSLAVAAEAAALGNATWIGQANTSATVDLKLPFALPAGPLRLDLTLAPGTAVVLLESVELPDLLLPDEPVRDPPLNAPANLDLHTGPAPGQLGADYLIVSHHDLIAAIAPLVAAKTQAGRSVAVVDVQAAYDTFSAGAADPEAIRSLVRAAATWHPAPTALLLVGSGSVVPGASLVPPYFVSTDPALGEVPCDTCFARIGGDNVLADPLPAIPVGRLPARTPAEAATLARKTADYLLAPPPGPWRSTALFVADNDMLPDGTPDPVGGFAATAEDAATLAATAGMNAHQLLYDPSQPSAPPHYSEAADLRCVLFSMFNSGPACPAPALLAIRSSSEAPPLGPLDLPQNRPESTTTSPRASDGHGVALLGYVGHGSPWQWAQTALDSPVPYLWYLYDADRLQNGGRLPILLSLSCLTGAWHNPDLRTVDEGLLLAPNGGTVASLSPAGLGVGRGHSALLQGVIPALTDPAHPRTLGQAHMAGLAALLQGDCCHDLVFSYNLLGDPDVTIPRPAPWRIALPLITDD